MPRTKRVSSLADLCIKNICKNILRHAAYNYSCTQNGQQLMEYYFLQTVCADRILAALSKPRCIIPTDIKACYDKIKSERKNKKLVDNYYAYLDFVFNPCIKGIPYNKFQGYYVHFLDSFLEVIAKNCRSIHYLSIRSENLHPDLSIRALANFSQLRYLDLQSTDCCDSVLISIWETCKLLIELNLNRTNITDHGLLALCGSNFEHKKSTKSGSTVCCRSHFNRQILRLHLRGTKITESGIACAFYHLPNLRTLHQKKKSILSDDPVKVNDRVSATIANFISYPLCIRKVTLNDYYLSVEKIVKVLNTCPHLESICLHITLDSVSIFQQLQMRCLRHIKIFTNSHDVFNSEIFSTFLQNAGNRLCKLSMNLQLHQMWDVDTLLSILAKCPNIIELQLTGCFHQFESYNEYIEQNLPFSPALKLRHLRSLTLNGSTLALVSNYKILLPIFSMPSFQNLVIFNFHQYSESVLPLRDENKANFLKVKSLILYFDPIEIDFLVNLICDKSNQLENLMLLRCPNCNKQAEWTLKQYARERNFDVTICVKEDSAFY